MNILSDEYLYTIMEQTQKTKPVECCTSCGVSLYSGEEVIKDDEGNYFCDEACFTGYHGMQKTIL